MNTFAMLGIWLFAIALILTFFAGARRVRGAASTAEPPAFLRDKSPETSIAPPVGEIA